MIRNKYGNKRTANQLAKELVYDYGAGAEYWQERLPPEVCAKLSEDEIDEIYRFVYKHRERIRKYLGCPNPRIEKQGAEGNE